MVRSPLHELTCGIIEFGDFFDKDGKIINDYRLIAFLLRLGKMYLIKFYDSGWSWDCFLC